MGWSISSVTIKHSVNISRYPIRHKWFARCWEHHQLSGDPQICGTVQNLLGISDGSSCHSTDLWSFSCALSQAACMICGDKVQVTATSSCPPGSFGWEGGRDGWTPVFRFLSCEQRGMWFRVSEIAKLEGHKRSRLKRTAQEKRTPKGFITKLELTC